MWNTEYLLASFIDNKAANVKISVGNIIIDNQNLSWFILNYSHLYLKVIVFPQTSDISK